MPKHRHVENPVILEFSSLQLSRHQQWPIGTVMRVADVFLRDCHPVFLTKGEGWFTFDGQTWTVIPATTEHHPETGLPVNRRYERTA